MIAPEQIVALYHQRKQALAPINAKRMEVRDAYNGELRVTLPDIGRSAPPAVANLLNSGLDQMAMRVASTLPSVYCPPRDEMVKREVTAADKRRKAIYGWWEANDLNLLVKRRARQMLAYASSPVMLWPDFERGIPVWRQRDPLGTYPSATLNPGDMTPANCIFAYLSTYGHVKKKYPESFERLARRERARMDDTLVLLDYVDCDELVTIVLHDGPSHDQVGTWSAPMAGPVSGGVPGFHGSSRHEVLERLVNKAGMCTVVIPGRVTLDRTLGHFDGMLSLYRAMAHLTALELIAVEKGIFPDTYLESRPGEQAKFVTGPHDGRTGLVNIVQGGQVREVATNPGFQTNPTIDRLERAQRLEGGIPAEWGGESSSNIRTGKRGDAVLSAAVDFPLQEQQAVIAASLREENKRAIAVAKGYFGGRSQSFYVSWKGAKGQVDFTPNDIFTTDHNVVSYSHVGSDLNGLMIMAGQAVGMGVMSKRTAARIMPIIEDDEYEHDQGIKESLEAALLAAVQQKANDGTMAPVDVAWLMSQVASNKLELAEAMIKLEERVQKRQAEAQEQMADPAQADPMMGLAAGTPAEAQMAPPPTIPEGPEAQQNLSSMLGALRMGQMKTPAERPAVA